MSPKWTWRIFLTGDGVGTLASTLRVPFLELTRSRAREPGEALRSAGNSGMDDGGGPDMAILAVVVVHVPPEGLPVREGQARGEMKERVGMCGM